MSNVKLFDQGIWGQPFIRPALLMHFLIEPLWPLIPTGKEDVHSADCDVQSQFIAILQRLSTVQALEEEEEAEAAAKWMTSQIHDVMDDSFASLDANAARMDWDPHICVAPRAQTFSQNASARASQSIGAMRGLVPVTWECWYAATND